MAARRLVLNGLTAEVGGEACVPALAGEREAGSPDSLEFYHELELYRQLLALPPAPALSEEPAPPRRARTPDPVPTARCHDEPRRSRTPGAASAAPAAPAAERARAPPVVRPARVSPLYYYYNLFLKKI
ncbi:unnamed protein product [Arctia plantaginis]|uniref:Uncharacterized protein n=1 Tax=Arctia plantaginis TaxID=874455 RepID=A0A8S1BKS8_ARCPL|nr:unnamed protein product [Arctia plantaginis]